MQDWLDGGISFLVRCPGFEPPDNVTPNKITMDVYITLRELIRSKWVSGDTAMLIQAYCEEFVIPHMQHFKEHCKIESIQAPASRCEFSLHHIDILTNTTPVLAKPISLEGLYHLPTFSSPLASRLQCTGLSAVTKLNISNDAWHLSPSVAICESALVASSAKTVQPTPKPVPATPSKQALSQAETNSPAVPCRGFPIPG
ncbi:hypothetical protein JVT61DRAFT_14423 [Boletus reticuloceps]|uniref:Uncharacterized protein n=1 Tax=Boletus reticuloceps TaxID=495285 RepID=A0A8I3ABS1_9AGAM|nr:hypothetical protein JVT61DRAFT_14423 [Boletus reticuloceps]